MTRSDLIKYANKNLFVNGKFKGIRKNSIHFNLLNDYLPNKEYDILERFYLFYNNIETPPRCICGKKLKIFRWSNGYNKFCSPNCGGVESTKTIKAKYNVDNVFKLESVKSKSKKTKSEKYGDENYNNNSKAIETNIIKYGVSNTFQLTNRIIETNIKKYGVKHNSYNKDTIEKRKLTRLKTFFNNIIKRNDDINPLFNIDSYYGIDRKNKYSWKCTKCGNIFSDHLDDGHVPRCLVCNPKLVGISSYEQELKDFLNLYNIKFESNSRELIKPLELDIYIPSHNLAIEFDGLYWHSDKFVSKHYHLDKTLECETKSIQLIHIFEDEWVNKRKIVEARLKNLLGLNSRRIGARQTTIKEIDAKTKNAFLNTFHIQGEDKSSIKLGAYYNDELIGVMTFGKLRKFMNKVHIDGNWELIRFVTISDTWTPGLASKMLTYFEKEWKPKSIESFADRRWSQGNLYNKLGFKFDKQTVPNYYYSKNLKRYHRYKFRKSELKNFDNYSIDKTEFQIMDEAGWLRIYDCGNYKFVK